MRHLVVVLFFFAVFDAHMIAKETNPGFVIELKQTSVRRVSLVSVVGGRTWRLKDSATGRYYREHTGGRKVRGFSADKKLHIWVTIENTTKQTLTYSRPRRPQLEGPKGDWTKEWTPLKGRIEGKAYKSVQVRPGRTIQDLYVFDIPFSGDDYVTLDVGYTQWIEVRKEKWTRR